MKAIGRKQDAPTAGIVGEMLIPMWGAEVRREVDGTCVIVIHVPPGLRLVLPADAGPARKLAAALDGRAIVLPQPGQV